MRTFCAKVAGLTVLALLIWWAVVQFTRNIKGD